MIIDEVSMLYSTVIEHLHPQLAKVKANPEINFGGVNIIFIGDFLQLPAVLNPDLYVNSNGLGHRLWRSLNGVVILTQQMRQARDPHTLLFSPVAECANRRTTISKSSETALERSFQTCNLQRSLFGGMPYASHQHAEAARRRVEIRYLHRVLRR